MTCTDATALIVTALLTEVFDEGTIGHTDGLGEEPVAQAASP